MALITSESKHYTIGSTAPPKTDGLLRIYSMSFCPFAERARIVLLVKKLRHEIVNLSLKDKPEWYLQLHPEGKVPALDIGSKLIVDSLDICDYLDETYPEPRLYPNDPQAKARDKELIKNFGKIVQHYMPLVSKSGSKSLSEHASEILELLQEYENELGNRSSTFFGGEQPSMVDYMIWPFAERAGAVDLIHGQKFPIPEDKIPRIRAWCNNMRKVDVIKATAASAQRHYNILQSFVTGGKVDYDGF